MPDCEWAEMRDALPDFLHGSLDAPERAAVESHIAGCAGCASELALLREMRAALSTEPAVNVARISAAVAALPRRGARGSMPHRGRHTAPSWRRPAAVAAGITVLASVALLRLGGVLSADLRGHTRRAVAVAAPSVSSDMPRGAAAPATAAQTGTAAEGQPARAGFEIGDLAGLSASEMRVLLDDIAGLNALPAADPAPMLPPVLPNVGGEV